MIPQQMTREELAAFVEVCANEFGSAGWDRVIPKLTEAARRLRHSVSRELYDKACAECEEWRSHAGNWNEEAIHRINAAKTAHDILRAEQGIEG